MEINKKIILSSLIIIIILLASFLRLWRISEYIVFLGDQGRDVLIVKRMIVDHKMTLLGPTASVGGFYLGPFYYYLMIIPLWISGLNPVGPAIMVAFFGILTVIGMYAVFARLYSKKVGLIAGFLYAISPLAVYQSRFSWNPNTWPFFTLGYFLLLYISITKEKKIFSFLAGLILGICLQLHYLALIMAPLAVLILYSKNIKKWFINCLLLFAGTLITFSPLIFFEIRHGFNNIRIILEFITRRHGAIVFYPLSIFSSFFGLSFKIFATFFGTGENLVIKILTLSSLFLLLLGLFGSYKKISRLLLIWWIGGAVLLNLYQGTLYNYYYGFLYPIPAISVSLVLNFLINKKFWGFKIITLGLLIYLSYFSYLGQPILKEPNNIINQTKNLTNVIIEESEGKPFNFALISSSNSDFAYRYFLEISGHKPIDLGDIVTEQLIVVCEDKVCEPRGNSLWEIAGFGRAEIVQTYSDKIGIKVIKLIHHPESSSWVGHPAPKGRI